MVTGTIMGLSTGLVLGAIAAGLYYWKGGAGKNKLMYTAGIFFVIAFLLGGFAQYGYSLQSLGVGAGDTNVRVATANCPAVATTGYSAVKNPVNTSTNFLASSVAYTDPTGSILVKDTATGGSSISPKSTTIPCTPSVYANGVYVYALPAERLSSGRSALLKFNGGTSVQETIDAYSYMNLSIYSRNTGYTNTSSQVSDDTTNIAHTQPVAVAVGSGGSTSGYLIVTESTSNSAYGSPHTGILFGYDNVDTAIGANDLTLGVSGGSYSLTPVACSTYSNIANKLSLDKCYLGRAITAKDAEIQFTYTIAGGLGDPTTDPILYMAPIEYVEDIGNKIILDGYKSDGTVAGTSVQKFTFNLS